MPRSLETEKTGYENTGDANVIQLGFNISVAGNSAPDVEIFVNDNKQPCRQSYSNLPQIMPSSDPRGYQNMTTEKKSADETFTERLCLQRPSGGEVAPVTSRGKGEEDGIGSDRWKVGGSEENLDGKSEEFTIIDEIKNAMGNFEKFSEHLREIPRLSTKEMYTSTPYRDKSNSRSEGNLSLYGRPARAVVPRHDFRDRKYCKKPKAPSSDVFLKPLPAQGYFKKGYIRRYCDTESYRHYASMDSFPTYYEHSDERKNLESKLELDKSEVLSSASDLCDVENKIVKKGTGTEAVDKQSTSSESAKDIKIFQSGGIIIMQNFNDNLELIDKKEVGDGSKLLENCSKLREKIESSLQSSDDSQKILLNSSSDEVRGPSGKFVQFDLTSCEMTRSKSFDSSSETQKQDDVQCTKQFKKTDFSKTNDAASALQTQDFTSLSTQENDSVQSNAPGMSPTSSTSGKKLEWDSGADVGYLNMDLTKENISTIERIILKGLGDDGVSKKQVIYEKTGEPVSHPSKFILQRLPSTLVSEENSERKSSTASKKSSSNCSSTGSKLTNSNSSSNNSEKESFKDSCKRHDRGISVDKVSKITNDRRGKSKQGATGKSAIDYQETKCPTDAKGNAKAAKTSKSEGFVEHRKKSKEIRDVRNEADADKKSRDAALVEKKFSHSKCADKSTFVDTLFSDVCVQLPLLDISRSEESGRSESSDRYRSVISTSPRVKKFTKKRSTGQGTNLTAPLKSKIEAIIDIAKCSSRSDEKEKSYVKDTSERCECKGGENLLDEEKRNEVKSIEPAQIVTKAEPSPPCSSVKLSNLNLKEKAVKSRPVSASSGSNHTVMLNAETNYSVGTEDALGIYKNFADQMIQTTEMKFESKGTQVLDSLACSVASDPQEEDSDRGISKFAVDETDADAVNGNNIADVTVSSSKSIQAPGLNCSLPKHLSHPKHSTAPEQQNTKGTQFFGVQVTSLPNFHSSVTSKDPRTVKVKVLERRSNLYDESHRINRENEKNLMFKELRGRGSTTDNIIGSENEIRVKDAEDNSVRRRSGGEKKRSINDSENKENVSVGNEIDVEFFENSKKSSSAVSAKESKDGSKKSESVMFGSCDVQLSDDGNMFLTSDLLREHGDGIDRNFLQEKYFQSQLIEFEWRHMMTRSTSMERKKELESDTQTGFSLKTGVSVGCQFGPDLTEENQINDQRNDRPSQDTSYESISRATDDRNRIGDGVPYDKDITFSESLSSSTQTAHSWVPGHKQLSPEPDSAIERVLSFEYLSNGRMYENNEEKDGKGSGEIENNDAALESVPSNDDDSSPSENEMKESEGGDTVVLENSFRTPIDSSRMKSLDANLTELEIVVSRLHEKEALFQKVTESVLSTVTKCTGSGDTSLIPGGECELKRPSPDAEEVCCEIEFSEDKNELNGSKPEEGGGGGGGISKIVDGTSTACQTDTMASKSKIYLEERMQLERRMNEEKDQQIKWIENEINHLNMLRSLLEKQEHLKNSTESKKRHHYLTEASREMSAVNSLDENMLRKILSECLPQDSAVAEDLDKRLSLKASNSLKSSECSVTEKFKEIAGQSDWTNSNRAHFGMALSLRKGKRMQEVTMLPVGVQVTLRDSKSKKKSSDASSSERKSGGSESPKPADRRDCQSQSKSSSVEIKNKQTERGIQYPSLSAQFAGNVTLGITNNPSCRCKCEQCNKSQCICLKASEKSIIKQRTPRSGSDSRSYDLDSTKPVGVSSTTIGREFNRSCSKLNSVGDMYSSRPVSSRSTSRSGDLLSRNSSNPERFGVDSDTVNAMENCICICHEQPLPRCGGCNLLNTCKKCRCYVRIKCCSCKSSGHDGIMRKKCVSLSAACCDASEIICQRCRCSKRENQICTLCSCHVKSTTSIGRCAKFEERSSQTEGKTCKCCMRNDQNGDSSAYRETKYMSERVSTTESRNPSMIVVPSENKYETEEKQSVDQKFPFQLRVPLEERNSAEMKNALLVKTEVDKRCPCFSRPTDVTELKQKPQCRCKNRNPRRSTEEHPRHYFLQVEETTEEEESSESCDNRNSLEVITIRVPIRKVCKFGRNGNLSPQRNGNLSPQRNGRKCQAPDQGSNLFKERDMYLDKKYQRPNPCNCCEDCVGHSPSNGRRPVRSNTALQENCRSRRPESREIRKHSQQYKSQEFSSCNCCEDCVGHRRASKFCDRQRSHVSMGDIYDESNRRKSGANHEVPYAEISSGAIQEDNRYGCSSQNLETYSKSNGLNGFREEGGSEMSDECFCCNDCPGRSSDVGRHVADSVAEEEYLSYAGSKDKEDEGTADSSSLLGYQKSLGDATKESSQTSAEKRGKVRNGKTKSEKHKKESPPKPHRKCSSMSKPVQSHSTGKSKIAKCPQQERVRDKCKGSDYYNFNKKEYMTKSELEREEKKKRPSRLTLQECLTVKRPDLYTRAECRRKIISEKTRDRVDRHNKRMECLSKLLPQCDAPSNNPGLKLFTTTQMKKQTKRFYKNLPEVTNKAAEEKKKVQFQTNKLMAEIFAKKLQLQTLKGCLNLSNSFTVMSTL